MKQPMKSISFVPKTIQGVELGGSCKGVVGWVMQGWCYDTHRLSEVFEFIIRRLDYL